MKRLGPVTAMGGALRVPGNVMFGGPPDNHVAEWNIYVDPTAAQTVIDSRLRVRLVSLDGTGQVPVTTSYAERVTREEVMAAAGDGTPVVDIGDNVAYPGFIDAHAHWIGDRGYYGIDTAEAAIDAAIGRGWTSISEQWVNQERIDELTRLAADGALSLRVDAYLALNYDREFFGDWYTEREPGPVGDRLRVRGLKIHLDDGSGKVINWGPADLTATISRADAAGWQVSVHAMSTDAQELVLDAFEASIGPTGPNPLHHRVEHATQLTDDQLARLAAMDIGAVIHLDGAADWILDPGVISEFAGTTPARRPTSSPAGETS